MTIHNPAEAKLSVKDLAQGWRICFVEELKVARPLDALYKAKDDRSWTKSSSTGNPIKDVPPGGDWVFTYITQTPPPAALATTIPGTLVSDDPLAVLAKMLGTS